MGKINMGRVIVGGLVAGFVIDVGETVLNMFLIGKQWDDVMAALHVPKIGPNAIVIFMALGLLLGILLIWVYAAIRPRFGAGPNTAIYAGLIVWALVYLYVSLGWMPMGIFPNKLLWISIVWGLFEVPIGAVAGAYFYKEEA